MPAVTMPRLSDSMEEGTIVRWLRTHGEEVTTGDELVEIETDKATMAYEAESGGVLTITVEEGATVRVGATIAHIGTVVEEAQNGSGSPSSEPGPAAVEAPAPAAVAVPSTGGPAAASPQAAAAAVGSRVRASPVARRLARALGVALETVSGSGPGGRIVKRDVEAAATAAPAAVSSGGGVKGESEFRTLVGVQATIARRMAEAKSTMPEFALSTEVDMEAAVALRREFAELDRDVRPPSLGDFVIKACALALCAYPGANASYRDGGIELHSRINVGVAVASPDALFVPTVFDADRKSLGEIAGEVRGLAERGRSGTLTPPEMGGATFTVSNLGMFGVTNFTAVLNPPQAAILAVGAVEERIVPVDGAPAVRQRMTVTLTCDHRVLYGANAAEFLAAIRANLEQPLRLVL